MYPMGAGDKRYPIDRNRIIPGGLLSRKIGRLQGTLIYQFCDEVARMENQTVEVVEGMSLYVFFNRYMPNFDKKPKSRGFDPRDHL